MRSMKMKLTILFNLVIHLIGLAYLVLPNSVEYKALLAFKSEINYDPNQVLSSWNDSLHYCDWEGVICGTKHPQRVVGIDLESKGLGGTLSPYVGNLSFLHHIFLFNNSFQGNIPPTLGRLSKLQYLKLTLNSFNGSISANMSHCLNLKRLGLGFNLLSGTVPYQLSRLVNLELLALYGNNLNGDLLNVVVKNMSSLQILEASANLFLGNIPHNIGEMLPRLTKFGFARNKLSGNIPNSFYNLSYLQNIGLSSNQLQGTLPSDIGIRLPQLTNFFVDNNFLQGSFPASLSNLTLLQRLNVKSNNFTGKFKFSAINIPNLLFIEADFNYLGTEGDGDLNIIQTFLNCSNLKYIELRHNNFGGSLPNFLGNFSTKMHILDLQFNKIVGNIPTSLFNLVNLQGLHLGGNHLTGQLSPQIGKLTRLEILNLGNNDLTGRIPNSIGNLSHLSMLYLANNSFQGTIPSSLGQCKNLLYLNFYHNNLSGPLSPLLFAPSSMIVYLTLGLNHLGGIIPTEIGQLENLILLDLSSNAFIDELPTSLSKCTALGVLDLRENFFTGSIPQSFKSLTSLLYMDLSDNKFSGPIPNYLIKFPLMEMNLSYNNFLGEVPTKGVFANQSAFNIVGNKKLCGGIPQLHLPRCPPKFSNNGKKHRLSIAVILIIAVASLVVTVLILTVSYLIFVFRRQRRKSSQSSALSVGEPFSKLSYDMLSKATNGFSEENLLGIGHFGSVYKGVLDAESNMVVAVKVFQFQQRGAAKSFMVECEALRNTRHRNLLKICTVCSSIDFQGNDFKALVYEFLPNGNLHQWIHSNQQQSGLSLSQRLTIALDVTCAVDYLHNDCEVPIIHCDLKPSNILLDADMVAHVGDFGLARFDSHSRTNNSSITVKGTVGYSSPEYGLGMAASKEGDIYSIGIILIELRTGKSSIDAMFEGDLDLHKYAQSGLLSDELMNIIDPRLLNNCGSPRNDNIIIECIGSVLEMGVKCSAESPQNRMRIDDAISELKKTRDIWLKQLRLMDRYAWNLDA